MVRSRRLELPLRLRNSDLNAARLPIPPRPHCLRLGGARIDQLFHDVKSENAPFRAFISNFSRTEETETVMLN